MSVTMFKFTQPLADPVLGFIRGAAYTGTRYCRMIEASKGKELWLIVTPEPGEHDDDRVYAYIENRIDEGEVPYELKGCTLVGEVEIPLSLYSLARDKAETEDRLTATANKWP